MRSTFITACALTLFVAPLAFAQEHPVADGLVIYRCAQNQGSESGLTVNITEKGDQYTADVSIEGFAFEDLGTVAIKPVKAEKNHVKYETTEGDKASFDIDESNAEHALGAFKTVVTGSIKGHELAPEITCHHALVMAPKPKEQ